MFVTNFKVKLIYYYKNFVEHKMINCHVGNTQLNIEQHYFKQHSS